MMSRFFTLLIIFSFIGIAVFGVFAMNHGVSHDHGCLAAIARAADCPDNGSIFDFISFHLNTFKVFSTAVLGENFSSILLLVMFLLAVALDISAGKIFAFPQTDSNLYQRNFYESFISLFKSQVNCWLALHENSPALLIRRF